MKSKFRKWLSCHSNLWINLWQINSWKMRNLTLSSSCFGYSSNLFLLYTLQGSLFILFLLLSTKKKKSLFHIHKENSSTSTKTHFIHFCYEYTIFFACSSSSFSLGIDKCFSAPVACMYACIHTRLSCAHSHVHILTHNWSKMLI